MPANPSAQGNSLGSPHPHAAGAHHTGEQGAPMAHSPADGHRGRMMQGDPRGAMGGQPQVDPRAAMGGQPQVDPRAAMGGQPSVNIPVSKQHPQMDYHSMQMYKAPTTMRQHPGIHSTGRRLLILGLRASKCTCRWRGYVGRSSGSATGAAARHAATGTASAAQSICASAAPRSSGAGPSDHAPGAVLSRSLPRQKRLPFVNRSSQAGPVERIACAMQAPPQEHAGHRRPQQPGDMAPMAMAPYPQMQPGPSSGIPASYQNPQAMKMVAGPSAGPAPQYYSQVAN